MDNMIFLAIDADNAGRLVGRAVLADDTDGLTDISARIDHGQEIILTWAQQVGGQRISAGGDEATVSVPAQAMESIEELRKDYEHATGLTLTVGVGQSLSQAGKALMAGKVRGKNQVVQYDDSVEQDLVATGKNVAAGGGSEEEQKINESYLQKDDETAHGGVDHAHADCEYCKEYDSKNGANPDASCDCPYCAEYDAAKQGDHSHDNCPYCKDFDTKNAAGAGSDCDCPYCQEYDASQPAQPAAQPSPVADSTPNPIMDPAAVPQSPNDAPLMGGSPAGVGSDTNPNDMPPDNGALMADGMIQNTSVPQGYDDNVPGDMGLAEDQAPAQPDMGAVLQGGLDNQADQIAMQKVADMVGQALETLKGQKAILEKAKEQAPELYNGVILTLKAMIEMAKMLGFGGDPETEQAQPAPAAPQQAQPVAPQEGAAPAPKGVRQ